MIAWSSLVIRLSAVVLGAFGVVFLTIAERIGTPKQGRVLVDDAHSEHWEPSARRLTPDWFGDFSTYSFSSAVELLGYYFHVDVNTSRSYDDTLLDDYDVVVLKTPVIDFAQEEVAALHRFVARGGGLMLIGDHTDLQESSTILNRFAKWAGIRLRFDAVSDARSGSFSFFEGSRWFAHPVVLGGPTLLFMTSCSLALEGDARPVMVVPDQVGVPGDYAHSSRFGTLYSDPRADLGRLVLAAEGTCGDGRILVFSDSTVLSSFGLRKGDRTAFLLRAISFLNTTRGRIGIVGVLGLVAAGLGLALGCAHLLRRRAAGALAVTLGAGWCGALLAVVAAESHKRAAYPYPRPVREVPTLAIEVSNGRAEYQPVLGTPDGVDPKIGYETMFAAIQRSGVFPLLSDDVDYLLSHDALMLLNPIERYSGEFVARVARFVAGGGRLIVGVDTDDVHIDALESIGQALGIAFSLTANPARNGTSSLDVRGVQPFGVFGDLSIATRDHGAGVVVLVLHTQSWSRAQLGHCFARPTRTQRQSYAALETVLSTLTGLAPVDRRTYGILE